MTSIELNAFLEETRIELQVFERWIELRWIVPAPAIGTVVLSDVDAARALLIRDLQNDLGVNEEGIDIVLHLVDQLHGMRGALHALRSELNVARPGPRRP